MVHLLTDLTVLSFSHEDIIFVLTKIYNGFSFWGEELFWRRYIWCAVLEVKKWNISWSLRREVEMSESAWHCEKHIVLGLGSREAEREKWKTLWETYHLGLWDSQQSGRQSRKSDPIHWRLRIWEIGTCWKFLTFYSELLVLQRTEWESIDFKHTLSTSTINQCLFP